MPTLKYIDYLNVDCPGRIELLWCLGLGLGFDDCEEALLKLGYSLTKKEYDCYKFLVC